MTTSGNSLRRAVALAEGRPVPVFLGVALLLYIPLIGFGWGGAFDSWRIADTGRTFMATGTYTPSRYPGFPVHEIPAAILAHFGGSLLSNAGTVSMALLGLHSFLRIIDLFGVPHRALLALGLFANPVFWTAATYTIDYVWSLSLLLTGFAAICGQRYLWGGLLLGLATGSRASSLAFGLVVLVFQALRARQGFLKPVASGLLAIVLGIAFYAPLFRRYGFLRLYFGDWDTMDYAANFLYGNLLFVGPLAALLIAALVIAGALGHGHLPEREWQGLAAFCVVIIVGYETLFLIAPIQVAYLLPALPCLLILLGIALKDQRRWLALWIILSTSSSLLSPNIVGVRGGAYYVESSLPPLLALQGPTVRGKATSLSAGLFLRWGYLVSDVAGRLDATRNGGARP